MGGLHPAAARYRYAPVTSLPEHWYPYSEDRPSATGYVQGRLLAVDADGARRGASSGLRLDALIPTGDDD